MGLHKNLSGNDLHDPKGVWPTSCGLPDDTLSSYNITVAGSINSYIKIDTLTSSEKIHLGNTVTNPAIVMPGSGNVGIGTATPGQKLVVEASDTDPHLHVQKTDGNRVDLFATANKSGIQDVSGERISFISGETVVNGDAINLDFRIKGDTDDNLFFANAGTDRIGIGTDSPQRQLHIGDGEDSGEDGIIRLEGYSASSAYHEIIADGDNLQFTRNTTQQLMLKYDGSVGIGVSNPTTKLDVNGTLKVSGIISGVATPVATTDAANKAYVDAVAPSAWNGTSGASPVLGGNLDCNGKDLEDANSLVVDTNTLVANLAGYTDKVGIGTATPSTLLHVDAGANPTANIAVFEGSNAGENNVHIGAAIGANNEMVVGFHYGGGAGSAANYGYMMLNGEAPGAGLAVADGGKIGIGTAAPDKALEVNSADGNNLRLTYNDASGSATTYADLQVSSSGHIAIRSSAGKGQGGLITKTVVQSISDAGVKTYSASELLSGYIIRDPAGSDRSDVFPDATDIVAAIPNCAVNDSFRFTIKNAADAEETVTMTAGSGITITGTATIARNNTKEFLCVITAIDGDATIYSLGTFVH